MADFEERREAGASLMVIGLALFVADMLVIFFAPAARIGHQRAVFVVIIVALLVAGICFLIRGYQLRKAAQKLSMEK
jgi:uncharacterized membrane protein